MEIELLAVRGSVQRRGYGGLLVGALARHGAAVGLQEMVTSADETAVGFFRAAGFRASPRDQASEGRMGGGRTVCSLVCARGGGGEFRGLRRGGRAHTYPRTNEEE